MDGGEIKKKEAEGWMFGGWKEEWGRNIQKVLREGGMNRKNVREEGGKEGRRNSIDERKKREKDGGGKARMDGWMDGWIKRKEKQE